MRIKEEKGSISYARNKKAIARKETEKKWIQGIELFLDRKKKYMGTKLLDFESESPTEMTLGTKNVVLLPS